MPGKSYEIVKVSIQGGKLLCTPDWIRLFWVKGPTDIRWSFVDMPKSASQAVVEFLDSEPPKYTSVPDHPGGFRARGVHRGAGHAEPSNGSHLPDIITVGNTHQPGYFYYDIRILDKAGTVIAQADPGGDNQGGGGGGG